MDAKTPNLSVKHKQQLNAKIDKLAAFIGSDEYLAASERERQLHARRLGVMHSYSSFLDQSMHPESADIASRLPEDWNFGGSEPREMQTMPSWFVVGKPLKPYQLQIIVDKRWVDKDIDELRAFLTSPLRIPADQERQLIHQLGFMVEYSQILQQLIDTFMSQALAGYGGIFDQA